MKIILSGCTRIVISLQSLVIKIPNFTCQWSHFLKGLIGNMQERNCYRWNSGAYGTGSGSDQLLCPVIWSTWGGWLLIMKKADCKKFESDFKNETMDYTPWVAAGFGGDDKIENYGYLNGRIVKVDYGS